MNLVAPKIRRDNLLFRAEILKGCDEDARFQKLIWNKCKENPIFYVDTFCYTRNPRLPHPDIPFILYDYQEKALLEIIDAILTQNDLLIEKTRDMGASWLVLYAFEWCFKFHDGSDFKVGSWKQEFVDLLDSMDSLMQKYRFMLKWLPSWLRDDIDPNFPFMRLTNGKNGNTIIGETASANFGSGGRRRAMLLDEYAKWEKLVADGAYTSTADVTGCRIFLSTPYGSGNKYAHLANEDSKIKKLTLHWTLHPLKNVGCYYIDIKTGEKIPVDISDGGYKAFGIWQKYRGEMLPKKFGLRGGIVRSTWYDGECERREDADIAQELDIDYRRSGAPFFDMVALNSQVASTYIEIPKGSRNIPFRRYITGDLVMVQNKVIFRQKPEEIGGWLRIYEFPNPNIEYVLSADTCEGLPKGDENFGIVRDAIDRNVVAVVCNKQTPEDFSYQLWLVHKWFNECMTCVENNNHGYSVNKDLDDLGTKLYYTKKYETKEGDVQTTKRGFTTSGRTRIMALDRFAEEISKKSADLRDDRIIAQCKTFVRPEKKPQHPEADGDFKDDGVLSCAICGIALDELPHRTTRGDVNQKKRALKEQLIKERRIRIRG